MKSSVKYNLLALEDFDPSDIRSRKFPKKCIWFPMADIMRKVQKGDILVIASNTKVGWWIHAHNVHDDDHVPEYAGLVPSSIFFPINPRCELCLDKVTGACKDVLMPNLGPRERKYFPLCSKFYGKLVELHENPVKTHSIFSRIFYSWISTYIFLGFKRCLLEEDLWTPVPSRKIKNLKCEINIELEKMSYAKPPLIQTFLQIHKKKFILAAVCKFIQDIIKFLTPFLIRLFIKYSENPNRALYYGFGICSSLFIVRTADSLLLSKYYEYVNLLGIDFRCTLSSMVYQKLFSIRPISLNKYTQSFQTNLVSVDSYRVQEAFVTILMVASCLLQIILCFIYLYFIMGLAFLAGLAVILLAIPMNFLIARISKPMQVRQMASKDARIKLITTMFNGIKLVKFYCWEQTFKELITKIRKKEVTEISKINALNRMTSVFIYIVPFLITLASFYTFIKINGSIDASVAFESMSIFAILRYPLMQLPDSFQSLVFAQVSYKRILEFLSQPNITVSSAYQVNENPKDNPFIKISGGNFAFDDGLEPFLTNINFEASSNELHVIVGENGSGKTKFLQSLINENIIISGMVEICGQVCYVPQNPWIRNLSLRDNILDGNPFDKELYDKVIDMCQLIPDIELLPNGDQTEIGERGINLSGGQKQRIRLACAIFSKSNIYLLDDPFSNLDKCVRQKIFQKIISSEGWLSDSIRVLVTHDDRFLEEADCLHLMKNGTIFNRGSYNVLIKTDLYFSDFISKIKYLHKESSKDVEDSRPDLKNEWQSEIKQPTLLYERKLVKTDSVMKGRVKRKIYYHYIRSQSLPVFILFMLSIPMYYAITTYGNIVVARYTSYNISYHNSSKFVLIYGLLCVGQLISVLIMGIFQIIAIYFASKHIHYKLLTTLLQAPLTFFETIPIGRIINAFTLEMSVIDSKLPTSVKMTVVLLCSTFFSVFSIAYFIPYMLIGILVLTVIYIFIQAFYIKSSRQLQRLESCSRAPILSYILDTINGISILRSNRCGARYTEKFDELIDLNSVPFKMNMYGNRWLGVRLELIGNALVFLSALAILISCFVGSILPGVVGYILFTSTFITQALSFFIRFLCDTENQIVSIERIAAFYKTQPEPEKMLPFEPVYKWPGAGRIRFVNYSYKYREHSPNVLHGLNFSIEPCQKMGSLGRTGSGKSSLVLSLFRMVDISEGSIEIDDVDINDISLRRLREALKIIPQGSLRQNIDPANQYDDSQIFRAIELSQLTNFMATFPEGLDYVIDETGSNVSSGEKQLICLARTLLKQPKILILDEATSNIDLKTDSIIQEVISREFKDCPIITIAHRVETIINYDRILVLENGRIAEFDSPSNLLSRHDSLFYSIVSHSNVQNI